MRELRRPLFILVALLVVAGGGLAGGRAWLDGAAGRAWLAATIAKASSGPGRVVSLGTVGGWFPGDLEISDIRVADAQGVWLTVTDARLVLDLGALLGGHLAIRRMEAALVDVARPPVAVEPPGPAPALAPAPAAAPFPPGLPVAIDLDRLTIGRLELGAPVLGVPVALTLEASATLGANGDGLTSRVEARRLDATAGHVGLTIDVGAGAKRVSARLEAGEAGDGLLARLAGLPGLGPVDVVVEGDGPLSDWRGRLRGQAGLDTRLEADAAVRAVDGGHRLSLRASGALGGVLEGLLGPDLAPLATGPRLDAQALIAPDGTLTLDPLTLEVAAGRLTATGRLGGPSAALGLDVRVDVVENPPLGQSPPVGWRSAGASLRVDGNAAALQARLAVEIAGLTVKDPKLGPLIGPTLSLDARADLRPEEGWLTVSDVKLKTALATLGGRARVHLKTGTAQADLRLGAPDLAPLGALAGQRLRGAADFLALVERAADGGLTARLAGGIDDFATGTAADGVVGRAVQLTATAERGADGALGVRGFNVIGQSVALTGQARLLGDRLEAAARLALDDLARLPGGVGKGRAALEATASGPLATPQGALSARATIDGHPLALDTRYALSGQRLGFNDLTLSSGADRVKGDLWVELASLLARGRLEGRLPDLAALPAPAGMRLGGGGEFTLTLDGKAGRQLAQLQARVNDLAVVDHDKPLASARALTLSGDLGDLLGTPAGKLRLDITGASVAGTAIGRLGASAEGSLASARFSLSSAGIAPPGTAPANAGSLELAGGVKREGAVTRVSVDRLQGTVAGQDLRASQTAVVELAEGRARLSGLRLGSGPARLAADASFAPNEVKGTLRLDAVPLALARLADPSLGLAGALNAALDVSGTPAQPTARLTASVKGLAVVEGMAAGKGLEADLSARWDGRHLKAEGRVGRAGAGALNWTAGLPVAMAADGGVRLPASTPLDATLTGGLPLSALNDLLAASGDRVDGVVTLDLKLAGTLAAPRLGGRLDLSGGRYENRASGAIIANAVAHIVGTGDLLTIQSFTATTTGGGTLALSGTLRPPGAAAGPEGRQIDLRLTAKRARVVDIDLAEADVDGALTLTGGFTHMVLAGKLGVARAEIQVPERLPPGVVSLDVVEKGGKSGAGGRRAAKSPSPQAAKPTKPTPGPGPTPARSPAPPPPPPSDAPPVLALDLTIDTPGRIAVRGRGLDAEIGGALTVKGDARAPKVDGRLTSRRGQLDLLGRTFTFTRGIIAFDGTTNIDPRLDIVAEATANEVTAQVVVSGTAGNPKIELASPQGLPQDEVLARVLFGRSSGNLGAGEAIQLAQAAAQLAGFGGGGGILDKVRRTLGIDRLAFGQDNKGAGALEAGRYIGDGVYIGVEQGIGATGSRAKVEIDLTDHIRAEAGVGINSESRVGIKFEWEY